MKITLQEIIDQVAEQNKVTKKLSEDFLREFLNLIEETLNKGDIVKIKGLGTFKLSPVEERKSVNVQTGEEMTIPAHNKIAFTPEKELKVAVNKPYSHLETYILSKDGPVDLPENEDEGELENEEEEVEIPPVIVEEEKPQPEVAVVMPEEEVKPTIIEQEEEIKPVIAQDEVYSPMEEKANDTEIDKSKETNKKEMKEQDFEEKAQGGRWIIIVLIILGLIALLLWLWHLDGAKTSEKEHTKTEEFQSGIADDEIYEKIDTDQFSQIGIMDETVERLHINDGKFDHKFDSKLVHFMQKNYPNMKLTTSGAPREVELKEGRRLTLLALEYYGDKQFWVYIYLYNTDIIKNPNNIPAGTVIKVPTLDKSLVDPKNQKTINVAKQIQTDLLKM